MNNEIIRINRLTKVYKTGADELFALNNVDLAIEEGEIVAVLGPSGSGKSTLLNVLGGIDEADGGTVSIDKWDVTSLKGGRLADYRRESVGFVFQFYNLIPNLTVFENVEVVADICKKPLNIERLLESLGIGDLAKRYPVELSGGQQQRVAIARAFVKNPKILLCDEPTGALDFASSLDILRLIKDINEKYNTTILIITHNSAIAGMCHRVVRLRSGKITHNERNENIIPVERIEW